jgi:hypothetical protein
MKKAILFIGLVFNVVLYSQTVEDTVRYQIDKFNKV